jgi:hypothetical protein
LEAVDNTAATTHYTPLRCFERIARTAATIQLLLSQFQPARQSHPCSLCCCLFRFGCFPSISFPSYFCPLRVTLAFFDVLVTLVYYTPVEFKQSHLKRAAMARKQLRYLSYLLRLWQTSIDGKLTWRASLEIPGTGKRRGFTSLKDLVAFLKTQTDQTLSSEEPGDKGDK